MGEGVRGHISKGIVLTKVDALVNQTPERGTEFDRRSAFLAELYQADTHEKYRAVLERLAGVTPAESQYLGATWYDPGGWWPNPQAAFLVVRQGLIKAIELAGTYLLLDSYWLPTAPPGVIEVMVCRSARQVTRIILTPPSPAPIHRRPAERDIWVIKPRTGQEQPRLETDDEVVESVDGNTVTWRVRDMPDTVSWRVRNVP